MSFLALSAEQYLATKFANGEGITIKNFVFAYVPDLAGEPEDRIASLPDDDMIVAVRPYTSRGYISANQVVYSLIMDTDIGDFDFNWVGLVDEDNVLIVVTHSGFTQKRKSHGAIPGNMMTRNVLIQYTGIQGITSTITPAESWQLNFGDRLNGIDERERLANLDQYGESNFFADGWQVLQSGDDLMVSAGVGYVGGIRVHQPTNTMLNVPSLPVSIWVDVSLQGDLSDRASMAELVVAEGDHESYVDENYVEHYLTKLADIAGDGRITDARNLYENTAQHEAKSDPHPQYNAYTDAEISEALSTAKNDATTKSNAALSSAKSYTDNETAATLASAVSTASADATTKANEALASAKEYVGDVSGSIHFFATLIAPSGFIKANGAAVSRTMYSSLFDKIGITFGAGDGSSTFNVPDLRGEFIRGHDDARGIDIDRVFGSLQDSANLSHSHAILRTDSGLNGEYPNSSKFNNIMSGDRVRSYSTHNVSDNLPYIQESGEDESRPRNIALAAYIKY